MNIKIAIPLLVILALIFIAILIESFIPGEADSPEDSDVIVILGGGDQGRVEKAADLYQSGYAGKVLITPAGDRYNAGELTSIVRHYGVEEEDVIVDTESTSTYSNAERTLEIMNDNNFESAMIVTSDYHLKRAKLAFERLNNNDKTFNYISASNLEGKKGLDREDAFSHWIGEFIKIWGYRFGLYNLFG